MSTQPSARTLRNRRRRQRRAALARAGGPPPSSVLGVPKMAPVSQNYSSGRGSVERHRFRESERIHSIVWDPDAGDLQTQSFALNPGLAATFPRFSKVANLYDKYRVNSLTIRFKNTCSTATDGNVLLSYDPNVTDNQPSTPEEITQMSHWIDGAPWRIFELKIPTDNRVLFTRAGAPQGNADLKTFDMGRLYVSSESGGGSTQQWGYIELMYDIELLYKQPYPKDDDEKNETYPVTRGVVQVNYNCDEEYFPPFIIDQNLNGLNLENFNVHGENSDGIRGLDPNKVYIVILRMTMNSNSVVEGGANVVYDVLHKRTNDSSWISEVGDVISTPLLAGDNENTVEQYSFLVHDANEITIKADDNDLVATTSLIANSTNLVIYPVAG